MLLIINNDYYDVVLCSINIYILLLFAILLLICLFASSQNDAIIGHSSQRRRMIGYCCCVMSRLLLLAKTSLCQENTMNHKMNLKAKNCQGYCNSKRKSWLLWRQLPVNEKRLYLMNQWTIRFIDIRQVYFSTIKIFYFKIE